MQRVSECVAVAAKNVQILNAIKNFPLSPRGSSEKLRKVTSQEKRWSRGVVHLPPAPMAHAAASSTQTFRAKAFVTDGLHQ